jgi:hypothetical protein
VTRTFSSSILHVEIAATSGTRVFAHLFVSQAGAGLYQRIVPTQRMRRRF